MRLETSFRRIEISVAWDVSLFASSAICSHSVEVVVYINMINILVMVRG